MPLYRVHFSVPVIYQPDHPRVHREVVDLDVWSDSPALALQHAIRTTQGDGIAGEVTEVRDA